MEYFVPESKEELIQLLTKRKENTFFAAGCTDLMIKLREKSIFQYSIIDLTHIEEGKDIAETKDSIEIGAFVTMSQLESHPFINSYCHALGEASGMVGSTQIRNLATIGGNIGNASQSADLVPVLAAGNAKIILLNSKGKQKDYTIEEFILGNGKTLLKQDEVIWSVRIPKSNRLTAFYKVGARKSVTISKINGCISAIIENGIIKEPSIYLGAVGNRALKAPILENALNGNKLADYIDNSISLKPDSFNSTQIELLKAASEAQIETNIPDRPSKQYKKKAVLGLLLNILEDLKQQYEIESDRRSS